MRSTLLLRNPTSPPISEVSRRRPVELLYRHPEIDRATVAAPGMFTAMSLTGPQVQADKPNRIADDLLSLQNLPSSAFLCASASRR